MNQFGNTIVVEPRSLVREGLVALMASHSYEVVGGFASTVDLEHSPLVIEAPGLVILGALPADMATIAAGNIRKRWPETKIILLFDSASSADFQKMLASEIDGCIPLFVSLDVLLHTLQQVITGNLRIMVLKNGTSSITCPAVSHEEGPELALAPGNLGKSEDTDGGAFDRTSTLRLVHGLTQREDEILKSVVRGHSNKMIARTCGVADATVKIHMKAILQKIRVTNRTQAAIWALEHGYGTDAPALAGASYPTGVGCGLSPLMTQPSAQREMR